MNILIIGLSSIVTRRVLPALKRLYPEGSIDVATRQANNPAIRASWTRGTVYESYADALKRTSGELVYVSLVNSEHERWTESALNHGFHVVVDKPAFLGRERAARMVELAARHDRCLAEATVFAYHPQMALAAGLFEDAADSPKRISMALSFPPLDEANFRYQARLGGGALFDVGPYLVATSRIFFGAEPLTVDCRVLARRTGNVEISFSALGTFSDSRSLAGHFGFDTAYSNRLQLIGEKLVVDVDRAFTTPADYRNMIRVTGPTPSPEVEVPPADAFMCFFEHVFSRIETHDWRQLTADLLADSRVLESYRVAGGLQ